MRRLLACLATAALAVAGLAVVPAPGASAASVPNLLSANQASVESSAAGFASAYGREKIARVRMTPAVHGKAVLAITSTTTKAIGARTMMAGQIASVGAVYSGAMAVRPAASVKAPKQARAYITFLSSSGRVISTVVGPWTATRGGRWVRLAVGGAKAPAGTSALSLYAEVATTAKAQTYFADAWGLWRASKAQAWAMPPTTDTIAPTVPALRTSVVPASTTIAVSFSSTDNVGISRYRIWFASGTGASATGTPTATTTGTSFVRPSLAQGTYSVVVSALDKAGHESFSSKASMTLGAPPATANLLTPSVASFESSIAGVQQSSDSTAAVASLSRSTAQHATGSASLRIAVLNAGGVSSGSVTVRSERSWTPAQAGKAYSGALSVLTPGSGHSARAMLTFYDSNQNSIGTPLTSKSSNLAPGAWARLTVSGTAPLGSSFVSMSLILDESGSINAGQQFYTDAWGVWASSSAPGWTLPTVPQGVVAAFIGDSYGLGVGVTTGGSTLDRFTTRVAATMGWREFDVARGGIGFVAFTPLSPGGPSGCGMPYCGPYTDQLSAVIDARPDVVFVTGGRNDGLPSNEQAAVVATIRTLHTGLPTARVVVVSPFWDDGLQSDGSQQSSIPSSITSIAGWEAAYVSSLSTVKVTFVAKAYEWLWQKPDLMNPPTSLLAHHPNAAGYHVLADNIVAALPDRPQ